MKLHNSQLISIIENFGVTPEEAANIIGCTTVEIYEYLSGYPVYGDYIHKLQLLYDINQCLIDLLVRESDIKRWMKAEHIDLKRIPKDMLKDNIDCLMLRNYVEAVVEF